MTKLALVYTMSKLPFFFTQNQLKNPKNTTLFVASHHLYYLTLHIKFATTWYSTQLIELFSYDTPRSLSRVGASDTTASSHFKKTSDTIVAYNFHNLFSGDRMFIFTTNITPMVPSKTALGFSIKSISELFANANWLEREVAEMTGIVFEGKRDVRNLMLTYGDSSSPLRKSFPSTGFKEVFYDSNNDLLTQTPITLQI